MSDPLRDAWVLAMAVARDARSIPIALSAQNIAIGIWKIRERVHRECPHGRSFCEEGNRCMGCSAGKKRRDDD